MSDKISTTISTSSWPDLATVLPSCNDKTFLTHRSNLLSIDKIHVEIAGSWSSSWAPTPCQRAPDGSYTVTLPLSPGVYQYKYIINGVWHHNPNEATAPNVFGTLNNVLVRSGIPDPLHVVVTGAAGQIAYSLLYQIASGYVFGYNQPLVLHLLDIAPMMGVLNGVVMEIQDCALPLVRDVIATDDPVVAFKDIDAAFLVGAMPRREGMERKDLLAANVKIFKAQGQALDNYAKKSVKILVVGNPANTNALMCSHYAPSIPKENFSAMTRLDHNRASAQIAQKVGAKVQDVKKVIIWGNHSSTQFPDAAHALVLGKSVKSLVDETWIQKEFVPTVQKRGAAVIAARKLSSAMSAAKAASDHMKSWFSGTADNDWVSMGVFSDGSYNTPVGVMFSFPVTIKNGRWAIVKGLPLDDFAREMLGITGKELCEEREEALEVCSA